MSLCHSLLLSHCAHTLRSRLVCVVVCVAQASRCQMVQNKRTKQFTFVNTFKFFIYWLAVDAWNDLWKTIYRRFDLTMIYAKCVISAMKSQRFSVRTVLRVQFLNDDIITIICWNESFRCCCQKWRIFHCKHAFVTFSDSVFVFYSLSLSLLSIISFVYFILHFYFVICLNGILRIFTWFSH